MKEGYEPRNGRDTVKWQPETVEINTGFYDRVWKLHEHIDEKKQAAADVLYSYSKFVMACIGNQVRPCDLRLHLMKEVSGIPTSLKKDASQRAASPDAMAESSSSGTVRLDKTDSFRDQLL